MSRNQTGSLYVPTGSFIERIDGSIKLLWIILWSVVAFMFLDARVFVFLIVLGLVLLKLSKVPWKKIRVLFMFIIFFTLMNSVFLMVITPTYGSELVGTFTPVITIGPYVLTAETMFYIATMSLKYIALLPVTMIFLFTTDPSQFASSLNRIGVPYKAAYAVTLALRYIPDVQDEVTSIANAQEARGVPFSSKDANPIKRVKNYTTVMVPLLLSSLDRIESVSNAMDLRGFGRYPKRTWYVRRAITKLDVIALLAGIALLVAALYFRSITTQGNLWYPF